ncbi:hypothetical protein ACFL08_05835 [Patescibacteria group bacterium]
MKRGKFFNNNIFKRRGMDMELLFWRSMLVISTIGILIIAGVAIYILAMHCGWFPNENVRRWVEFRQKYGEEFADPDKRYEIHPHILGGGYLNRWVERVVPEYFPGGNNKIHERCNCAFRVMRGMLKGGEKPYAQNVRKIKNGDIIEYWEIHI